MKNIFNVIKHIISGNNTNISIISLYEEIELRYELYNVYRSIELRIIFIKIRKKSAFK